MIEKKPSLISFPPLSEFWGNIIFIIIGRCHKIWSFVFFLRLPLPNSLLTELIPAQLSLLNIKTIKDVTSTYSFILLICIHRTRIASHWDGTVSSCKLLSFMSQLTNQNMRPDSSSYLETQENLRGHKFKEFPTKENLKADRTRFVSEFKCYHHDHLNKHEVLHPSSLSHIHGKLFSTSVFKQFSCQGVRKST